MKFFIPFLDDDDQAEMLWAATRRRLGELGLATTHRRIRALACTIHGKDHFVAVGAEVPNEEGDLAMIILESADLDMYFVCTPGRGLVDDIPYPLTLDESWRVVDFEEEVVGWA